MGEKNNDRSGTGFADDKNNYGGQGFSEGSFSFIRPSTEELENDGGSYVSGTGFGGEASYSGTSSFGGNDNSYGGTSAFGVNENSTGGRTSGFGHEPSYDPNAMFTDTYKPMYQPDNPVSSPSLSSASVRTKSNNKTIILIALALVFVVVAGFVVYKSFFEKGIGNKSIQDYMNSEEGQKMRTYFATEYVRENKDDKLLSLDVYAPDNKTLVYDMKYDVAGMSAAEKQGMDNYVEMARPTFRNVINKIMNEEKMKKFSIKLRFLNKNDSVLAEYTIDP